ncbi:unnamed protein product [Protopolystoma xenopodis]|uniref:Uncharacterized protein n=1 Tax=Protopolystoma xenopodis TaxID=117903 RepID=A0A448X4U4_9PLAT|nr:unnamed protein product [Protopolystoma xenopodis]
MASDAKLEAEDDSSWNGMVQPFHILQLLADSNKLAFISALAGLMLTTRIYSQFYRQFCINLNINTSVREQVVNSVY